VGNVRFLCSPIFRKTIPRTLDNPSMLIINVKDNESIDRALTAFEKPSVRRRFEILRAVYKEKTYGHLED
jgi:small subunit ribosomal protein S21